MGFIDCLVQRLPAVSYILFSMFHGTCEIGYTGAILIVLQAYNDFGL